MKCSLKRGCFSSHALTAAVLCVELLSRITCRSSSTERAAVDLLQEGQGLLGPVSLGDATDDLARQDVKGGIQTGRAVALAVMRPSLDLPGLERQHGLGAIQRLDLRFLVNRQHQRVVGRIQVQPDHIDRPCRRSAGRC
ncbi:hypothetical protein D9M71_258370 [compost metagenome]